MVVVWQQWENSPVQAGREGINKPSHAGRQRKCVVFAEQTSHEGHRQEDRSRKDRKAGRQGEEAVEEGGSRHPVTATASSLQHL